MDLSDSTTQYTAGLSLLALAAGFLLFQPTGFVKWLQKKNYQYEVTFSLYMLTPTEKFVFNSILFLTFSLFLIASVVYLPNHIMTMSRRTYYYFAGDASLSASSRNAAETLYGTATRAADAASEWVQTAFNRTTEAAADAAVSQAAAESVVETVAQAAQPIGVN
ncbi:Putative small subunit of serine palmitoyltransferase [Septoria linicola]|uniref:Small subunit of serine palmitoyltransferase n=1 Tax=Septoria linicola TaxID=215465 RepID=A0A9Q9AIS0_9PEZI|nr:putative small subunit of serine palmitoyltransferase [Septoria linicola]USW49805.1 Putative small subunit of serine palmitoyltransferase [Septoria linicola]